MLTLMAMDLCVICPYTKQYVLIELSYFSIKFWKISRSNSTSKFGYGI